MTLGNDNGTDGQTDRVRRNMRPPPREEGRITRQCHNQASGMNVHVHESYYYDTREANDVESGLGYCLNKQIIL